MSLTLGFTESSLTLTPGATHSVGVSITPPASHTVRLSLVGDSRDAFLDAGGVTTDAAGEARFSLTAPSSPATFQVRATAGAASAELPVSVAEDFTTVAVWPLYSGTRPVESWTATVSLDDECGAGEDTVFEDGPLFSEASNELPRIRNVPVGPRLRVTVRAGHFAGGCTDSRASFGSPLEHHVFVAVHDRPLQLAGASLRVKLGLDSGDGWAAAWSDVIDDMVNRFVARKSDSAALLDAMYAACPPPSAASFVIVRGKAAWDSKLSKEFDSLLGVGTLTHRLRSFLTAGVGADGSTSLEGSLVSGGSSAGKATLSFSSIGGVPAERATLPRSLEVTWTSGTGDRVLFGGAATFQASSLAAELGEAVARKEVPTASTFAGALAESLSCADVARVLVGSTGTDFAYAGCGQACVAELCATALGAMWARARETTEAKSKLELSASGAVRALSDTATPLGFEGTWIGTTTVGGRQARVSGGASGTSDHASVP